MGVTFSFVSGVMFPQPRICPKVGFVQFLSSTGQVCRTKFHMVVFSIAGHSVRICSNDSTEFSQFEHFARVSWFGMLFQKSPIRRDPAIARYRKFCIGRLISGCRRLFQRESFVSRLFVTSLIVYRVMSRFMSVCLVYCVVWLDFIASYTAFCVRVVSLSPRSWNDSGISQFISSGWGFVAPWFASWSAHSFPRLFV